MASALSLLMLWAVAVNTVPFAPSRWRHASTALLIGSGIAVLGHLTASAGPVAGLLALVFGAAMLRWPPGLGLRLALHRGRRRLERA
ncbi:DUF2484 family protein [Frigidibacter sp. MR17.14]|uniref:DUF2484 family protein n=1 Tax=Frigidibacter sp. MR17.14 TaxID=3126509 RepID=UPI003012D56F